MVKFCNRSYQERKIIFKTMFTVASLIPLSSLVFHSLPLLVSGPQGDDLFPALARQESPRGYPSHYTHAHAHAADADTQHSTSLELSPGEPDEKGEKITAILRWMREGLQGQQKGWANKKIRRITQSFVVLAFCRSNQNKLRYLTMNGELNIQKVRRVQKGKKKDVFYKSGCIKFQVIWIHSKALWDWYV